VTPTLELLGLEIPMVGPFFYVVLAFHAAAGLVAVISGALAALSRKGGYRHVCSGDVYFAAIGAVFGTAAVLGVMRWREDYHLIMIGGISFAGACVGRLVRTRHAAGHTLHILGMGVSFIAMLTAFYVDNGPQLPLWNRLPSILYWLLPLAVGGPIMIRAIVKTRSAA
jgi:hypothetical protein